MQPKREVGFPQEALEDTDLRAPLTDELIPEARREFFKKLMPHQKESVNFLLRRYIFYLHNRPVQDAFNETGAYLQGLILGHEMGLGKTAITLFFLSCLFTLPNPDLRPTRVLITLLKTLVPQWKTEISTWCPGIPILYYQGDARSRFKLLTDHQYDRRAIILCTYETMVNDSEKIIDEIRRQQSLLRRKPNSQAYGSSPIVDSNQDEPLDLFDTNFASEDGNTIRSTIVLQPGQGNTLSQTVSQLFQLEPPPKRPAGIVDITPSSSKTTLVRSSAFDLTILDEATRIKNSRSQAHLCLRNMALGFKIALTGTPVMNDLMELWGLVDFLNPGYLGTRLEFEKEYNKVIFKGELANASEGERLDAQEQRQKLVSLLRPILLRRTQSDLNVVEAKKLELILWVPLLQQQFDIYRRTCQDKNFKRSLDKAVSEHRHPLNLISYLRQLCTHPSFVSGKENFLTHEMQDEIARIRWLGANVSASGRVWDTTGYFKSESIDEEQKLLDDNICAMSGKFTALRELLRGLQRVNARLLIFSEFKATLEKVKVIITELGMEYLYLDGKITSEHERKAICDRFNTDKRFSAFLMTTAIGSMGLNLTGANRVILLEPNWNPQAEAQAIGRAYRYLQEREVVVYRLVCCNTIEEKMIAKHMVKRTMTYATVDDVRCERIVELNDVSQLFEFDEHSYNVAHLAQKLDANGHDTLLDKVFPPDDKGVLGAERAFLLNAAADGTWMVGYSTCDHLFANEEKDDSGGELPEKLSSKSYISLLNSRDTAPEPLSKEIKSVSWRVLETLFEISTLESTATQTAKIFDPDIVLEACPRGQTALRQRKVLSQAAMFLAIDCEAALSHDPVDVKNLVPDAINTYRLVHTYKELSNLELRGSEILNNIFLKFSEELALKTPKQRTFDAHTVLGMSSPNEYKDHVDSLSVMLCRMLPKVSGNRRFPEIYPMTATAVEEVCKKYQANFSQVRRSCIRRGIGDDFNASIYDSASKCMNGYGKVMHRAILQLLKDALDATAYLPPSMLYDCGLTVAVPADFQKVCFDPLRHRFIALCSNRVLGQLERLSRKNSQNLVPGLHDNDIDRFTRHAVDAVYIYLVTTKRHLSPFKLQNIDPEDAVPSEPSEPGP
ncbi:putative Transcriptional regulator ATRX [Giardia muris]|uniref:Putative Transcriptional regulator ATRX n=1 Tax=Giardia muris TaxID=5742 RepID=A0A4Z1T8T3_GIAMU|nr:putative Transcriptional regulator ATRX [Giardia muris]|eukprot:TNJ28989.1 putative Transcriptional regulator ATRX [Giardia muris]